MERLPEIEFNHEDGRYIPFFDIGNGDLVMIDNSNDQIVIWMHETEEQIQETGLGLEEYFEQQDARNSQREP